MPLNKLKSYQKARLLIWLIYRQLFFFFFFANNALRVILDKWKYTQDITVSEAIHLAFFFFVFPAPLLLSTFLFNIHPPLKQRGHTTQ